MSFINVSHISKTFKVAKKQSGLLATLKSFVKREYKYIDAIKDISFNIEEGSIVGYIGQNGAGKSTLMSMLFGMYEPDEGEIYVRGKKEVISSPTYATELNIGMVHQHFKLVDVFTVLDNIILGAEDTKFGFLQKKVARQKVQELSEKYKLHVDLDAKIEDITVGMQQRTEILKMLYRDNEILIFDESTAVLTPQEIEELIGIMRGFAKEGKSILFITHKLNEIMAAADRCTVLRKGKYIGTVDIKDTTKEELSRMMVGRDVNFSVEKKESEPGDVVLKVENLSVASKIGKEKAVKNVSFEVRAGEIIGIAGIDGNGQSELVFALTGLAPAESGQVLLDGRDIWTELKKIREIRFRVGMVFQYPEYQLFEETVYKDIAFGPKNMGLKPEEVDRRVREAAGFVGLTEKQLEVSPFDLSGGQKRRVAIAGVIAMEPKCIVLDEPTAMLDPVGRRDVMETIERLNKEEGITIILITHYMDEAVRADRVVVMDGGRILTDGDPRTVFAQVELLKRHHLDVPQATELVYRLNAAGCSIPGTPLNEEECIAAIESYLNELK